MYVCIGFFIVLDCGFEMNVGESYIWISSLHTYVYNAPFSNHLPSHTNHNAPKYEVLDGVREFSRLQGFGQGKIRPTVTRKDC